MTEDPSRAGDATPWPVDPDLTSGRAWPGPASAPGPSWDVAGVVAAGGAVGGFARWGLDTVLPRAVGTFPWSTFVENVAGCLLLGLAMVWLHDGRRPGRYAHPMLAVGVLGGFTTFSSFTAQLRDLLAAGRPGLALCYLSASLALGLLAVVAGVAAGRLCWRRDAEAVR